MDYNPVRIVGARLGAHYTFDASESFANAYSESLLPRDYFFFSTGIQSLNSDITFYKTVGPALTLGYGHWFNRYLGYQLSGGWSSGGWHRFKSKLNSDLYSKQQFAFGRGELMLNAYNNISESGYGFSLAVLGGMELGKLWRYRTTLDNQTEAGYSGFTGGVRAKYHVGEGKAIYLEPRVTFAHFTDDKAFANNKDYSALSSRYTLSLGMEYGSPYLNGVGRDEIEDEFKPLFSAMAYFGPSYVFNRGTYNGYKFKNSLSYSYGLGVEYQPFRLFGARVLLDRTSLGIVNMELKPYTTGEYAWLNTRTNITSGIFDLKLDLTSLLYGYRSTRHWSSSLYAGPILSYTNSSDNTVAIRHNFEGSTNWGAHLAFQSRYNFGNGFGLFGEADLRIYKNEFLPGFNQLDYNPVRIVGARLGITYNIK